MSNWFSTGRSPPKILRVIPKEDLVQSLNAVLRLRPRQRRFLRDCPALLGTAATPPRNEGDIVVLTRMGLVSRTGAVFTLSARGNIAREEIWQAERYIAEHFATPA